MPNRLLAAGLLILTVTRAPRLPAQEASVGAAQGVLTIAPAFPIDQPRSGSAPFQLTLNRPLTVEDGSLVLIAGAMDLSALTVVGGTTVTVMPGAFALPPGSQLLTVLLRRGDRFDPVATFPLRIQFAGGFTTAEATPNVDLNSGGVAASGGTGFRPPAGQEVNGTVALRTLHERGRWTIESNSSVIGVADATRALRFGELGDRAPRFDLASYKVNVRGPGVSIDLGHVSMETSRHLVAGLSARGVLLQTGSRRARVTIGSMAGTSLVGWDNLLGVGVSPHRLNAASLDLDVLRDRPGGLEVRLSGLDGSLQPLTGFTQGAVVDAEASRGASLEVAASTPGQRLRGTAGYTVSSFRNPLRDDALTGGLDVPALERDRRGARFLEGTANLLESRVLHPTLPRLTLGVTVRHERIDPLFRSVGSFMQADRRQDALELSGALGRVAWQGARMSGRDNLADVASILTSRTEGRTATVTVPLAELIRARRPALWPRLDLALLATHQFAVAPPASNDFRPQDLADQRATQRNTTLSWFVDGWTATVRDAMARQDNRQATREAADFTNHVVAATVGRSFGGRLDLSAEGSVEAQRNLERDEVARTRRLGVIGAWRPSDVTTIGTNLTVARSRIPPSARDATNLELRAELIRVIRLYGRGSQARTGQLFLRYARTLQRELPFGALPGDDLTTTMVWTLNSGLSLRLR